jgi:hypothetical protein
MSIGVHQRLPEDTTVFILACVITPEVTPVVIP